MLLPWSTSVSKDSHLKLPKLHWDIGTFSLMVNIGLRADKVSFSTMFQSHAPLSNKHPVHTLLPTKIKIFFLQIMHIMAWINVFYRTFSSAWNVWYFMILWYVSTTNNLLRYFGIGNVNIFKFSMAASLVILYKKMIWYYWFNSKKSQDLQELCLFDLMFY